jgi:hypothetical protein
MAADEEPTKDRGGEEEAVIEAATRSDAGDSDYEPLAFDAESANTSMTSSLYKHSYENGRR